MRTSRKPFTRGMFVAVLIAFFALTASAFISRNVFERYPHLEDEFAYLFQAKVFAGGHAWAPGSDPFKYVWQPFIIQPEPPYDGILKRFGKYAPGWPLVLSIGVLLGQTWVINAFLALLTTALVYRMAREIFDEAVGIVSALLLSISPMVLLLNATLMSHTIAMFAAVLATFAYWRTTKHGKGRYRWAMVSGLCLGFIFITRPLTAVAIAAPLALHALSRLLESEGKSDLSTDATVDKAVLPLANVGIPVTPLLDTPGGDRPQPENPKGFLPTFRVQVLLALAVIPTAALLLIFNQIWLGTVDYFRDNGYLRLWSYDQVGFGPDHGLNPGGHNLSYGWRNARTDLNVYMRDMFGFTMDPSLNTYAETNFEYGGGIGLSWIPVLAGLIAGRKKEWVWVFFEFFIAIVIAQLLYWIGSTVNGSAAYSLRYYYEATFGVCIVAGYGAVAWARSLKGKVPATAIASSIQGIQTAPATVIDYLNGPRDRHLSAASRRPPNFVERLKLAWNDLWPGYFILLVVCGLSLGGYTPARFHESLPPDWPNGLYHYNKIGAYQLDAIQQARQTFGDPKQSVLIVVLNSPVLGVSDNWRDYGVALSMTSPYLDSDIIVARVFDKENAPEFVKRFPGRLVLYQIGEDLYPTVDQAIAGALEKEKTGVSQ